VLSVGTISLSLLFSLAFASENIGSQQVLDLVQRGEILTVAEIQRRHVELQNVRWLDIELEKEHGLWIYEFKVVDEQGTVIKYILNAKDAEFIEQEHKDD